MFTCDITKPFVILNDKDEKILFDVITAWEVMEHIAETDISVMLKNIALHIEQDGVFICSIATVEDVDPVTGTRWHQTVKPREWWINTFRNNGFFVVEQNIINKDDWVRGSGHNMMDWSEDEGLGFHLVLKKQ